MGDVVLENRKIWKKGAVRNEEIAVALLGRGWGGGEKWRGLRCVGARVCVHDLKWLGGVWSG